MTLYWAVAPYECTDKNQVRQDQGIIVIPDQFHWLAAVFPLPWALWHAQWRWALFLAVISLAVWSFSAIGEITGRIGFLAGFAFHLWYGFEAQALRYAEFRRRGYQDLGMFHVPVSSLVRKDLVYQRAQQIYALKTDLSKQG